MTQIWPDGFPRVPADDWALERAGFTVEAVEHRVIEASVAEWTAFLGTYHEGVLGWVGGSERVEGVPPTAAAVADRLELLQESIRRVFPEPSFRSLWTYVDARSLGATRRR